MRSFRPSLLAVLLGLAFTSVHAQPEADLAGKRVDNSRVDLHSPPPPSEIEPAFSYPLPSGMTRAEARTMQAAVHTLPTTPEILHKTYNEIAGNTMFASGDASLTISARSRLDALADSFRGKLNLRIAVSGHTDNQRLSPNAKKVFRDNQGLSEARALTVAGYLKDALMLQAVQVASEGHGESQPVAGNDTADGMALNRRVEIRIWYDEAQTVAVPPPAASAKPARALCSQESTTHPAQPFSISIDGEPMETDASPLEADRQRCVDVALERADIQVRYDSLNTSPALNIWATQDTAVKGLPVEFRAWSNYVPWLRRAELRLFRPEQR